MIACLCSFDFHFHACDFERHCHSSALLAPLEFFRVHKQLRAHFKFFLPVICKKTKYDIDISRKFSVRPATHVIFMQAASDELGLGERFGNRRNSLRSSLLTSTALNQQKEFRVEEENDVRPLKIPGIIFSIVLARFFNSNCLTITRWHTYFCFVNYVYL